jgi:hypothetical protein
MVQILLQNARVFDGFCSDCPTGMSVLVEGGLIREVADRPIAARCLDRMKHHSQGQGG